VGSVAGLVVLIVGIGLLVQLSGVGSWTAPLSAALTVAGWAFTVVGFVWAPAVMSIPVWVLFAAWREGRRRGSAPSWGVSSAQRDTEV
jgi:DNA segregation ATPase FtsK/SpoIIIE, S-DNA-T family